MGRVGQDASGATERRTKRYEITRFIAAGDTGGNVEIVSRLLDLELESYDCVVFTGDIIAMKELRAIGEATARGFSVDVKIQYDDMTNRLNRINEIFAQVSKRTRLFGIFGNSDLRQRFISLVPEIKFENIHRRIVECRGCSLIGYEGRPMNVEELQFPDRVEKAGIFPGRTYRERAQECNAWPEQKAIDDLSELLQTLDPRKSVLVTHYPPHEILDKVEIKNIPWAIATYGERAKYGNIGSLAFREITERYGILLHVFSHVHEARGTTKIGDVTHINVGSLEEKESVCEIDARDGLVDANFRKI